jgi:hypothetical protein
LAKVIGCGPAGCQGKFIEIEGDRVLDAGGAGGLAGAGMAL